MKKVSIPIAPVSIGIMLLIVAWFYYFLIRRVIAEKNGTIVTAEVADVPNRCDRRNSIQVKYNNNLYSIPISRSECRRGEFTPGYGVQVLYYQPYDIMERPDGGISAMNALILFTVIIFIIGFVAYLKERRQ